MISSTCVKRISRKSPGKRPNAKKDQQKIPRHFLSEIEVEEIEKKIEIEVEVETIEIEIEIEVKEIEKKKIKVEIEVETIEKKIYWDWNCLVNLRWI